MESMLQAAKVKRWKIRHLYHWLSLGIYDDELLREVGWQLCARCEVIIGIWRAGHGAVPCPNCAHEVPRLRPYNANMPNGYRARTGIECPSCTTPVSWADCRIALRGRPRCLDCGDLLTSDAQAGLGCARCETRLSWKRYRDLLRSRLLLPCPACGHRLRKSDVKAGRVSYEPTVDRSIRAEVLELLEVAIEVPHSNNRTDRSCPECGKKGKKADGRFRCRCGYDVKWSSYKNRRRSVPEMLSCKECGHEFDWQSWARANQANVIYTGNPAPAAEFMVRWPRCKSSASKMAAIDQLIHGVHVRGALAHYFIEGHEADVVGLLNELADGSHVVTY